MAVVHCNFSANGYISFLNGLIFQWMRCVNGILENGVMKNTLPISMSADEYSFSHTMYAINYGSTVTSFDTVAKSNIIPKVLQIDNQNNKSTASTERWTAVYDVKNEIVYPKYNYHNVYLFVLYFCQT